MGVHIYTRVSTADQDLEHQKDNLWDYASNQLEPPPDGVTVVEDTATGTNADRDGIRRLMERARGGRVEMVIVRDITRLGRNLRDIYDITYELVEDLGVGLHAVNDDIRIDPGEELSMQDKMYLSVLGWGAELEAKKTRENVIAGLQAAKEAGRWTGRPPFGFTTDDDGFLVATEDYHKAMAAIHAVETLGWSQRKAAKYSGVPRSTVVSILGRKGLYLPDEQLDEFDVTIPEEFSPDQLLDVHERVLSELKHGSMPKDTIVETVMEEHGYDESEVAMAIIELAAIEKIEPHPQFDGCWREN